jgi:hypothetical protein
VAGLFVFFFEFLHFQFQQANALFQVFLHFSSSSGLSSGNSLKEPPLTL